MCRREQITRGCEQKGDTLSCTLKQYIARRNDDKTPVLSRKDEQATACNANGRIVGTKDERSVIEDELKK